MHCLVVDDDLQFSKLVIRTLEEEVPELRRKVDHILTEKALLGTLASSKPFDYDVIVLDVMVRWTDITDTESKELEPEDGGYFRAGIRCLAEIRNLANGASIPVLIHSARDSSDIERHLHEANLSLERVTIFQKDGDFKPLVDAIRALLPKGSARNSKRQSH